jgi:rhamnose transport system permease protein
VNNRSRLVEARELPTLILFVLICMVTALVQPKFLSTGVFRSILLWIPLLVVVAMGEMMVMLTRGVDVSVGSMMGLAGMAVGIALRDCPSIGVYGATTLGIALGATLGAVNGLLVAYGNVPAIVATLGTLGAYRGLVHIISHGVQVDEYNLPRKLGRWSIDGPFGQTLVPWVVVLAILVAAGTFLFLRFTRVGRDIYAIGGNPEAAWLRGIPVRRVTFLVYVLSGLGSGLAGVLYASRFGTINPAAIGSGFELIAISAVVVGGVSVFGGSGTVAGVVLGCLLLGTISTALTVLNIADAWQGTMYGVVIMLAVIFDHWMGKRFRNA